MLHIITRLAIGGAQDNTLLTCACHDRNRFEVHLASNPAGPWLGRAVKSADEFHSIPHLVAPIRPIKDILALIEIILLLRRRKFQIVHLHSAKAGFLGRIAGRITGCPTIYTVHGFPFHQFMPVWQRHFYIHLERMAMPLARYYITLSEADKLEGIRQGLLPQDRTQRVITGLDLSRFQRPLPRSQMRCALGLASQCIGVVFVGRLDPQKAPLSLLEAFFQIYKEVPNARLFFVGDGQLAPRLVKRATDLGLRACVSFLGDRQDVPDILNAMDVFAFSSRWEAMGRALIEAMVLGKAVIAPALSGIPEIVHHNETGILYQGGNTQELAAGLLRLIEDENLRVRLGRAAAELTQSQFSHEQMLHAIEDIYDRLLLST